MIKTFTTLLFATVIFAAPSAFNLQSIPANFHTEGAGIFETGNNSGSLTSLDGPTAPLWVIDASHSAVNFRIRHFFTPVPGVFERWGGNIWFDATELEGSHIDVTIQVASINTKNERRDNHLRTADFFDADKYPEMRFVSTSIRSTGENDFIAVGNLTIRDVTQEIELPFQFLGSMPHPRRANTTVAGFQANYELLRNDFGVGSGQYVETAVIGNTVTIEIFLEVLHIKPEGDTAG